MNPMNDVSPNFNVEDLSIKTATIEIKTITLNRKRLTQSVFRQIQEEPVFSAYKMWEDNETRSSPLTYLRGNVLGFVNYFWKEAQGELHILWELEGKLRRSLLISHLDVKWREHFEILEVREHQLLEQHQDDYLAWFKAQDDMSSEDINEREVFYTLYMQDRFNFFDRTVTDSLDALSRSFLGKALEQDLSPEGSIPFRLEDIWAGTRFDESSTARLSRVTFNYYRFLKYMKANTEQLFIAV